MFVYDHMMMLVRSLFQVYLIIIALYHLYMWSYWFEEGIIHFAGLLEQEEQEED